jgi:hypothetical protein
MRNIILIKKLPDKKIFTIHSYMVAQRIEALCYKPKATDWIPDCVIGIFHCHNYSSNSMALGSTQPVTEMSTRNISWGVKVASA